MHALENANSSWLLLASDGPCVVSSECCIPPQRIFAMQAAIHVPRGEAWRSVVPLCAAVGPSPDEWRSAKALSPRDSWEDSPGHVRIIQKMAFDPASRVIVSAHTHQTGELTHAETCRSVSLSVHWSHSDALYSAAHGPWRASPPRSRRRGSWRTREKARCDARSPEKVTWWVNGDRLRW